MVSLLLPIGSNEAIEEVRVDDRGEILTHGPATVLLSLLGSEYRVHYLPSSILDEGAYCSAVLKVKMRCRSPPASYSTSESNQRALSLCYSYLNLAYLYIFFSKSI